MVEEVELDFDNPQILICGNEDFWTHSSGAGRWFPNLNLSFSQFFPFLGKNSLSNDFGKNPWIPFSGSLGFPISFLDCSFPEDQRILPNLRRLFGEVGLNFPLNSDWLKFRVLPIPFELGFLWTGSPIPRKVLGVPEILWAIQFFSKSFNPLTTGLLGNGEFQLDDLPLSQVVKFGVFFH